ncbi:sensor histidine kinase [Cesiribacter andamanensis]|uniref:Putative sensor-like histidine kinase YehU n=1 Tax=Cesiribacter andamanensis AMV16 TaxID=1279009 RepID=M7NNR1_9BACT|nr:histidine kinase [Cesiribacter andamanensis]EMR03350.1 putative sensor-like histidine kinase YehU [Cesiribacter andamanensis AMV16]
MKDDLSRSENFNRVEFWAVTTLFVFAVFFFISEGIQNIAHVRTPNRYYFDQALIYFDYYRHYFWPQLIRYSFLFVAFLVLNFRVVPQLIRRKSLLRNVLLVLVFFVLGGLVYSITDTYLKNYLFAQFGSEQEAYNSFFLNGFLYAFWLLLMLALYTVIKYLGIYLLSNAETLKARYPFITQGGLVIVVLWMIGIFLLLMGDADRELIISWCVLVPSGIMIYWYSFYALIPQSLNKKRPFLMYLSKVLLIMAVAFLPIALLVLILVRYGDLAFVLSMFNVAFQVLVAAPLCWVLYKRQRKGEEQLFVLQRELGHSHATFDFLRSQINPHFLFNALNTMYGTALQEGAERTGEGIQKLGDMMRFMLQENMQEKIALAREIEYLHNYISLQRLRTDSIPGITIHEAIEQPVLPVQIAPMLLIPFVENAFKHGISFREPSHISITLEVREQTLYFDVHNSKHTRPENDPERDKSGIGLSNVRQRLQLLYPQRHELLIRETGKEYFVHLTVQLSA